MHKSVKLALAAMSLGAAGATIGAVPAGAQEECIFCEPTAPGADPYYKITEAHASTLIKLDEVLSKFKGTETFQKLDLVFNKVGDIFNKFVSPPTIG